MANFYRQFVKPSLGEIIDEYRYINLLSSPRTHIVNAFSNLIQGVVLNPVTKLYSGGIDLVGSALRGTERTHYISEVPAYNKRMFNSIGEAYTGVVKEMRGKPNNYTPDISRIPTTTKI